MSARALKLVQKAVARARADCDRRPAALCRFSRARRADDGRILQVTCSGARARYVAHNRDENSSCLQRIVAVAMSYFHRPRPGGIGGAVLDKASEPLSCRFAGS